MGTAAISAMAIGIGADYAVYFLFRVREEFERTGDLRQATSVALTTSGKAIAYVNVDTAVTGPNFGASGVPSLRDLVREVAALVPERK